MTGTACTMKILVPLYIYPLKGGDLAPEWKAMKDAQESGVPVIAVANPGSGPGTELDRPSYAKGMAALRDSGVEVIGYVATGYGKTEDEEVKRQIDVYKAWYGEWVQGIFLDETSREADKVAEGDKLFCVTYKGYTTHIKKQFGSAATVVMNTGTVETDHALMAEAGDDVIWNVLENSRSYMESQFGKVPSLHRSQNKRKSSAGSEMVTGTPPAAPAYVRGRAAFLVHGAAALSPEEICQWVFQLRDGGWTHMFMTDYFFEPGSDDTALLNPWNGLPKYWSDLVRAVEAVRATGDKKEKPKASCCFGS